MAATSRPCFRLYLERHRSLGVTIRALSGNAMCPSHFRKQQSLVVAGAVENMDDFDGVGADAVENQVIAKRTSANTEMFVARHQRIAARRIR